MPAWNELWTTGIILATIDGVFQSRESWTEWWSRLLSLGWSEVWATEWHVSLSLGWSEVWATEWHVSIRSGNERPDESPHDSRRRRQRRGWRRATPDAPRRRGWRRANAASCSLITIVRLVSNALVIVSIAAIWIAAFSLHGGLPAKIPLHFDFSGTPDRWGAPNFWNWFLLPIIGTVTSLLLIGIGSLTNTLLNRFPSIVNVPRKEKLLLLDPLARARALRPLSTMLRGISILILWLFLYLIIGTSTVALGAWLTLPVWPLFVQIPLMLLLVAWNHWQIARAIDTEFLVARLDNR